MNDIEKSDAIGHIDQAVNHLVSLRNLLRRTDTASVRGTHVPVHDLSPVTFLPMTPAQRYGIASCD